MKQCFSIVFVALLLFNVVGYYGVFLGLEYRNDILSVKRLDAGRYDESETFTLKIPLAIPYVSGSSEFQRLDGEYEHQGKFYRAIKQRFVKDTLFIVCLKDYATEGIHTAFNNYVKTFSNTSSDNHPDTKTLTSFIKDYLMRPFALRSLSPGWEREVSNETSPLSLTSSYYPSITHPPDRL